MFVAHRAARGAHLLADPAGQGHRHARSARGVPRQLLAGRRDAADPRRGCASSRDLRVGVRNLQTFNIGGGNRDIDFAIRGPELERAGRVRRGAARASRRAWASSTPTRRCKLNKPELRARIDRARAADLGVRTQDVAAALRLMVGGDQEVTRFRDRAGRRGLRRPAAAVGGRSPRSRHHLAPLRVARQRRDGAPRLGRRRSKKAQSPSRVDRLDRQRQANVRAGVAPGYALADRLEALRAAAAELGMPAGYTTAVSGRGRELERTFREFGWAFTAVDRVHVHGAGGAVREPAQPVHHPAVAAAVAALRAAVDLPDRQHAEPVFGARHAGAVRRRRQERASCRSITRSTCGARASSAARRSSRPIAIGCGRS